MAYQTKVVLHCVAGEPKGLATLVENFLRDGVKFVGVAGKDASRIEDIIDELVVGDGSDNSRIVLTSSHKTVTEALEFAHMLTGEYTGEVQLVEV